MCNYLWIAFLSTVSSFYLEPLMVEPLMLKPIGVQVKINMVVKQKTGFHYHVTVMIRIYAVFAVFILQSGY